MRRFSVLPPILLSLLAVLVAGGCSDKKQSNAGPVSETYFIFDTVVNIRVYDDSFTEDRFAEIGALLERIDATLNRNESGSDIERVNRNAGKAAVQVSEETFEVVKTALEYAEWSGGKFDPTVGPLVDLWGIGNEGASVPDSREIERVLELVDYRKVVLDEANRSIRLGKEGMSLDLGAIGKGYAADAVREYLLGNGFQSAMLDLGGNLVAMGGKPDGSDWSIGIQDPAEHRGEHLGIVRLKDKTLVSSGIYERFFREGDKLYHHIFNTSTGYPVENELLSVTIITDRSMIADALSTTIFAMGLDQGLGAVEQMADTEAIFVTKDGKLHLTSGLAGMFTVTNSSYEWVR